jgi:hypothetical protein
MSTRELTEDHGPLADSELDAVTGGFFADLVRQSIRLANEAQYPMMSNVMKTRADAAASVIENFR